MISGKQRYYNSRVLTSKDNAEYQRVIGRHIDRQENYERKKDRWRDELESVPRGLLWVDHVRIARGFRNPTHGSPLSFFSTKTVAIPK